MPGNGLPLEDQTHLLSLEVIHTEAESAQERVPELLWEPEVQGAIRLWAGVGLQDFIGIRGGNNKSA